MQLNPSSKWAGLLAALLGAHPGGVFSLRGNIRRGSSRILPGGHASLFHNSQRDGTYRVGGKRGYDRKMRRTGFISARQMRNRDRYIRRVAKAQRAEASE